MSEKKDMNSYFREKFGTDNLRKAQTILGHKVTAEGNQDINSYFRGKYGTDDLDQVQSKLDEARARGELPPGQLAITVEKIVEKEVTRTPDWAQHDNILVTDVQAKTPEQIDAEIAAKKLEAAEKLRNKIILECDDSFCQVYGRPAERTVQDPIRTLKEERTKAEKMSIPYNKDSIFSLDQKLVATKNAPEAAKKMAIQNQRSQYDFPDNPTQAAEIAKMVEKIMAAYQESFEKMNKAVPYLEETRAMYQAVLAEKVQLQAAQLAKTPETLEEMQGLSKSAEKWYPKIMKLSAEYLEDMRENNLDRLAVVVEEYIDLQSRWMSCKRELYGLDPQPQFPPMPDLPVLPRKLWKKIQQE